MISKPNCFENFDMAVQLDEKLFELSFEDISHETSTELLNILYYCN